MLSYMITKVNITKNVSETIKMLLTKKLINDNMLSQTKHFIIYDRKETKKCYMNHITN